MDMREIKQKSIVGTKWRIKPNNNPHLADIKDEVCILQKETPLCITLMGCDSSDFYRVGRGTLMEHFTLLDECPKEGFKTCIGTMLI